MTSKFFVTKDANGLYRWVGSHTNSFLDLDGDILTSESHKEFQERLERGEEEMPPLLLVHNRKWAIGQSDVFLVDEVAPGVVFVVVSGTFNEGMEIVAEKLAGKPATMSHGLYALQASEKDGANVITRYRTVEISALPDGVASPANPLTYYVVEDAMGIVDSMRRGKLAALIGNDTVELIEEANAAIGTKAVDEGIQFKETNAEEEAVEAVEDVKDDTAVVAEEQPAGTTTDYVTAEQFTEFANLVTDALEGAFTRLGAAIDGLQKNVAELEKSTNSAQEKLLEIAKEKETPVAARPGYDHILRSMLAQSPEVKTGAQAAAVEQTKAQASTPFVASGPMGFLLAAMENGQNDN